MKKLLFFLSLAFYLNANAQYSKVLDFNNTNGKDPQGSLISDGTHLYGMTTGGGTHNVGTIFRIKPDGTGDTVLFNFSGTHIGSTPSGALYYDGSFLYGMTAVGGNAYDDGVIFKIKPDGTNYDTLKLFNHSTGTGYKPYGSLISDGTYLYGLTSSGGVTPGYGTIFKIKPDGSGFSVLYSFSSQANGWTPQGDLVFDSTKTVLYGMTNSGGTSANCNNGCGVVFKINSDGTGFTKLVDFAGPNGANSPYTTGTAAMGSLIYGGGFFYGMSYSGGTADSGTIFKMKPDGSGYTIIHNFSSVYGAYPTGSLYYDGNFLYGTTGQGGGSYNSGTLFKIRPDGTNYSVLTNFSYIGAIGEGPVGTLISDGTYLYGMTSAGGANYDGAIFKLCVPASINTATICAGGTATLTATGATNYNYTWNTTATANSITVTPNATAVYTVTGTVGTCTSVATTTVTVINALPTLTVTGNSYTVCNGTSQTFTASGSNSYTWAPAASLDNANVASPTANPTTTTVYTVTSSNACGVSSDTITLTVNPIPTLSVTSNSYTICAGGSATLTASGASTYTWVPAASLNNANIANPVALPLTTTIYTVYATSNGCDASPLTVTVTVNQPPSTPVLSGNNPITLCQGAPQTLSVSVASGGVAVWFAGTAAGSPLVNAGNTYTPPTGTLGTTVYSIKDSISYLPGCVSTPLTVTVIVSPTPSLSVQSANASCNGLCNGSATVTASSGTAPYNFVWTPSGATITGSSPISVGSNLCAGTYSCIVTDVNNCTNTIAANITQPPALTLTINQTNVSCNGMCDGTASLTTISGGNPPYMVNWSNVTNQPVATGLCAGTYTCNVTDVNGCTNNITTTITQPTAVVATYTLVQDTAPHTWDAFPTFSGGTAPYTYNWNWGDSTGNSSGPYPSHTYAVPGMYNICVTVTDMNGCVSTTYCQNDSVYRLSSSSTMVYVNVINGVPGGLAYQHFLADTVTEFDEVGICYVTLRQNSAQQTVSNCLNVNMVGGGGPSNIWYANGDSLYNGKTYKKVTYSDSYNTAFQGLIREDVAAKKVYFIQFCNTTEELLYNFSLMKGDTITYNFAYPNANMNSGVYTVDSIRLKQDYQNFYHKHFYLQNHAVSTNLTLEMVEGVGNVSHPLFLYYQFTQGVLGYWPMYPAVNFNEGLSCKYNNSTKVYADSILYVKATATVYPFSACNYCLGVLGGVQQNNNLETISIYPSPAQNNFTVETNLTEKQTLQVFDVTGKQVLLQTINGTTIIDASNLNAGVYSVNITSSQGAVTKKLVIVK